MKEKLQEMEVQHQKNYHDAVMQTIHDNALRLVNEDLLPLFSEPPLASMDVIKTKILEKAKEHKIILSTEELSSVVQAFREEMQKEIPHMGEFREQELGSKIETVLQNSSLVEHQLKRFCDETRTSTTALFQKTIARQVETVLLPNLPKVIDEAKNPSELGQEQFLSSTHDYFTHRYLEYLQTSFVAKVSLKDQTLINRLLEHQDRYQFTVEHSHLLESSHKKPITKSDKRS